MAAAAVNPHVDKILDQARQEAALHFPRLFADCAPGERPDTIHLISLPRRWFQQSGKTAATTTFGCVGVIPALEWGSQLITNALARLDAVTIGAAVATFGPVAMLEIVAESDECEVEGPVGLPSLHNGIPIVLHARPPRRMLDASPVTTDLEFELFVQYRTEAAVGLALTAFASRDLVFAPPNRGPFSVRG